MKSLNYKSRVLKRQNSKEYIDYLINCAKEGDEDAKLNLIDAYSGLVINSIKNTAQFGKNMMICIKMEFQYFCTWLICIIHRKHLSQLLP